jgi:hypothetical protein
MHEQALKTWLQEVVIGLKLCPFAKEPWEQQRIRIVVCTEEGAEALVHCLYEELDRLDATSPEALETTLVAASAQLQDFEDFLDLLAVADALIDDCGWRGQYQIVGFHPDYCFEGVAADDAANYTNRAPMPVFHLLREASIEAAVSGLSDPASIYERNIALLRGMSTEERERLFPTVAP